MTPTPYAIPTTTVSQPTQPVSTNVFPISLTLIVLGFCCLFLLIIGVWAIILGIVQLAILIKIKDKIASKNILLFNGLLKIVPGGMLCSDR